MEDKRLERLREAVELIKTTGQANNYKEIASQMGYKRENTISDVLMGKANLSDKFVINFCNTFGFNTTWLIEGTGEIRSATYAAEHDMPYKTKKGAKPMSALNSLMAFILGNTPSDKLSPDILEELKKDAEIIKKGLGNSNRNEENQ